MRIDSATGNLNANHIHLESKKTAIDQPTGFDRSLAIVIGINDYMNGIPTLKTPINDATEFARLLNDEHGYEVHLFTQEVTHAVLTTYFTQTLPSLNLHRQDRLLLYFAGHGIALDGEDGPSGYLIPQDAKPEDPSTFLAMRDLHEWLNDLNCRQMLAILDCCFAGAFRWASTRHVRPLPETIYQERYDRFIRDPAWQITSAAYDQKALDFLTGNSLGERGTIGNHSPFAQSLFQALDGAGDLVPSGEGDGVITATELSLFLRDNVEAQVKELGRQHQTPQLWPLTKHDKGEYIFLVPGH
ncbi:caspase family protein, partial [Chloroflexi bacterium TSY]|nr:caspase family protein [Chloroflexi bacterium TSY]